MRFTRSLLAAVTTPLLLAAPVVAAQEVDEITDPEQLHRLSIESLPHGIDVASHQHAVAPINWPVVAETEDLDEGRENTSSWAISPGADKAEVSPSFAFIKATEGTGYVSPTFADDIADAAETDLLISTYHYARPRTGEQDAARQARHYAEHLDKIDGPTLPPVLDIEVSDGLSPDQLVEWTREFIDTLEELTGRETMIYTYPSFWVSHMGNSDEFSDQPLWIADYSAVGTPRVPDGWDTWTFWQDSDNANFPGVAGPVDRNVFNGSERSLERLIG